MQHRYKNEIALGIFFFLVIGLLIYMFHAIGGRTTEEEIEVTALFDSASGLVVDNYVMIAGVPVGRVSAIEVAFDRARVTMLIRKSADVRADARAHIRAKSLLGEKYVELLPESKDAPPLASGAIIEKTQTPVEVDEVFTSLRPFFDKLEPMAPQIEGILKELETLLASLNETGSDKRETLVNIIDNTDKLLAQTNRMLDTHDPAIGRNLSKLENLLNVANRRAPGLLKQAEGTLARIDAAAQALPIDTMRRIPDTYDKLDRAVGQLLPTLTRLEKNGDRIERILKNVDVLMQRLVLIDELAIRRFLQEEGVNVNMTQDSMSKKRIEELEKK